METLMIFKKCLISERKCQTHTTLYLMKATRLWLADQQPAFKSQILADWQSRVSFGETHVE